MKEGSRKLGNSPSTSVADASAGWKPKSSFLTSPVPSLEKGGEGGGRGEVFFIKTCGDTKSSNTAGGVWVCVSIPQRVNLRSPV